MKYRIELPKLNTVLEMSEEAYKTLDQIELQFEDTGKLIPAREIRLGNNFFLLCPEKEFEAINE